MPSITSVVAAAFALSTWFSNLPRAALIVSAAAIALASVPLAYPVANICEPSVLMVIFLVPSSVFSVISAVPPVITTAVTVFPLSAPRSLAFAMLASVTVTPVNLPSFSATITWMCPEEAVPTVVPPVTVASSVPTFASIASCMLETLTPVADTVKTSAVVALVPSVL